MCCDDKNRYLREIYEAGTSIQDLDGVADGEKDPAAPAHWVVCEDGGGEGVKVRKAWKWWV